MSPFVIFWIVWALGGCLGMQTAYAVKWVAARLFPLPRADPDACSPARGAHPAPMPHLTVIDAGGRPGSPDTGRNLWLWLRGRRRAWLSASSRSPWRRSGNFVLSTSCGPQFARPSPALSLAVSSTTSSSAAPSLVLQPELYADPALQIYTGGESWVNKPWRSPVRFGRASKPKMPAQPSLQDPSTAA